MTPVAIVGTGAVGVAIATSLRRGGVDALLVSRDPRSTTVSDIPVVSFDDLAADTDTFVIAVPGPALERVSYLVSASDGMTDTIKSWPIQVI